MQLFPISNPVDIHFQRCASPPLQRASLQLLVEASYSRTCRSRDALRLRVPAYAASIPSRRPQIARFASCTQQPANISSTPCSAKTMALRNGVDVGGGDYGFDLHVAEERDLLASCREENTRSTGISKHSGLNTDGAQFLHLWLRRLGLELLRRCDPRQPGDLCRNALPYYRAQLMP